ncbi:MAG TPA: class I SAM-dependent methyltransferase [Puia sp.]|nr:class I SAM-dependent methyltransferase [Puia sp.]
MIDKQEGIIHFYDEFFKNPVNVQFNERILFCYKQLIKGGLTSRSTVLELGCGGGALTALLGRKVRTGNVEAVDISPYAIEFARKQVTNKIVHFHVQDIVNYSPGSGTFDFITLFDVLEHVSIQDHRQLFQNIAQWMSDNTLLLINIPNPRYLEYDRHHQPEALQIIDQPLHSDYMARLIAESDMFVHSLETMSIWVIDDYQFFIVKKNQPFLETKLSVIRNFRQKTVAWLQRKWNNWYYAYPKRVR